MANYLPPGLAGLLGLGLPGQLVTLSNNIDGWRSRLREGAIKAPSGTRIKFDYVDLSREFELRGTAFEYAQVSDAYVQRKGFGPRKYPLTCYFSGRDCDRVATAFEAALCESGFFVLYHPLYGTLNNVVPFGTVQRSDPLGTAANQTIVNVTFWTTTGAVYPNSDPATQNEIALALGNFNVEAAQKFAVKMNLSKAALRAGAIATIKGYLKKVSGALSAVSSSVSAVRRQMQDIEDAINFGIDTLIGQPLQLALQICNLIQAPARAIAGINSRLDGYNRLLNDIIGSAEASPGESFASGTALLSRRDSIGNDFHISDLFATAAVSGSILASAGKPETGAPPTFTTRTQAIAAADAIASQYDQAVAWRDEGFAALDEIEDLSGSRVDTGEGIQQLQEVTALSVAFLVQASFGLRAQRERTLDSARTIVDLSAELHQKVDEKLDVLIDANDLSGDQILELQSGTRIVYFPDS